MAVIRTDVTLPVDVAVCKENALGYVFTGGCRPRGTVSFHSPSPTASSLSAVVVDETGRARAVSVMASAGRLINRTRNVSA